jgi:hypothetical protein
VNGAQLTVEDLHAILRDATPEMLADDGSHGFFLSLNVLKHFFGRDWVKQYAVVGASKNSFMFPDLEPQQGREHYIFRVITLAEMLYNLQGIENFDACISQVASGQIESAFYELSIATMLHAHDHQFRFIRPSGKKTHDYDLEITFNDGVVLCADTKSKATATDISPNSIRNSLNDAREQLPPDRPGAVFMCVPQKWIEDASLRGSLTGVADGFLRGTGRVVSVKFYTFIMTVSPRGISHRHAYFERDNPKNRFEATRCWDVFSDHPIPTSWNGMPPKWQRILMFPEGAT